MESEDDEFKMLQRASTRDEQRQAIQKITKRYKKLREENEKLRNEKKKELLGELLAKNQLNSVVYILNSKTTRL